MLIVSEKYLNALRLNISKFEATLKEINELESKLDILRNDLMKFIEDKKEEINKIDHDDSNSITTLENIMIEYDVKTSELIKTAQPVIDKHNKNKDDISELYKSLITEYSNYTEEEILEAIKAQL